MGGATGGGALMGWAWWAALAAVACPAVWSWLGLNPMTAPASSVSSNRPAAAPRCDIKALLPMCPAIPRPTNSAIPRFAPRRPDTAVYPSSIVIARALHTDHRVIHRRRPIDRVVHAIHVTGGVTARNLLERNPRRVFTFRSHFLLVSPRQNHICSQGNRHYYNTMLLL